MKIYRINAPTKIFTTIFVLLMCWLGFFVFLDGEAVLYQKLAGFLLIFSPFLAYLLFSEKILVDGEKIVIYRLPIKNLFKKEWQVKKSLRWVEIEKVKSNYVLYPESPIIILEHRENIRKGRMEILIGGMGGMDLDLLRDILAHLPSDTKISLYPHLEKMLQRRPDSKRKVIIIATVLIFTVTGGFLLTLFKLDNIAIILSLIVLIGILIATTLWHKKKIA